MWVILSKILPLSGVSVLKAVERSCGWFPKKGQTFYLCNGSDGGHVAVVSEVGADWWEQLPLTTLAHITWSLCICNVFWILSLCFSHWWWPEIYMRGASYWPSFQQDEYDLLHFFLSCISILTYTCFSCQLLCLTWVQADLCTPWLVIFLVSLQCIGLIWAYLIFVTVTTGGAYVNKSFWCKFFRIEG